MSRVSITWYMDRQKLFRRMWLKVCEALDLPQSFSIQKISPANRKSRQDQSIWSANFQSVA